MAGITDTTSTAKAIFSLDIVTAALALILLITATAIVLTRVTNGRIRSFSRKRQSSDGAPLKTSLATHLCLVPALCFLAVAYAVQSALVALQVNSASSLSITSAFSYPLANAGSGQGPEASSDTRAILSFVQQLAAILFTFFLTAAVWLHSNNLTSNGTGTNAPGIISKIWNTSILTAILAFGLATWGRGLAIRTGNQSFPSTIESDNITRILYVVFRCVVVFSSTSVSIEVLRSYSNLKKNGIPGNKERSLLARFAFIVVPIIWLRNVFIIVNVVLIYQSTADWSRSTNQALAFLIIITGQLANVMILLMVLWGAWSMGKTAGGSSSRSIKSTGASS